MTHHPISDKTELNTATANAGASGHYLQSYFSLEFF